MAKKTSPRLVALSSAAIVSVWGAGYLITRPEAAAMAASETAATANTPVPAATPTALARTIAAQNPDVAPQGGFRRRGSRPGGEAAPATAGQPVTATATAANAGAATAVLLKDGIYQGSGMGRRGGVNISLTIASGKITSAAITSLTIHYPHNILNGLPSQVVTKQSSQVDLISGATDSSLAFRQAVTQALNKAKVA